MLTDLIPLTIDGHQISVPPNTTIHQAALTIGIQIPTICYHEACTSNGLCRICVVEVQGARVLVPACVGKVTANMVVLTQSERVRRARRSILEMLASSVDLSQAPEILDLMTEYQAEPQRFPEALPRESDILDDNSMYIRDYSRCILCWRCVQVCAEDAQYTHAINFSGRGYHTSIDTFYHITLPETTCVFCGQCIGVCPTGAIRPKRMWLLEIGYSPAEIMQLTNAERKARTGRQF